MFTIDLSAIYTGLLAILMAIPTLLSWLMGMVWRIVFAPFRRNAPSGTPGTSTNTPVPYSLVFVIIASFVLYFYVRTWTKHAYGGELLVHKPHDLDKLASYKVPDLNQYNYTLTFWLYLDSVSPGFSQSASEFTDVVLYGGNVLIAYNAALNTLRVILKNGDRKHKYDIVNVPLQSWNQVGLLYSNGTFDIFMNGELQKSLVAVPQPSDHEVLVGFEKGVQGQLCTMMFYNKVLTMNQLERLYTQFKDKNPPTV